MRQVLRRAIPAAALVAVFLSAPAHAAERTTTVRVGHAPGTPARYDKVFVTKFGSAKAASVLVLIPGTGGGAGDFTLVARELVRRVPGLQVWALDRREQALEDTSMMEAAHRGTATPQQALGYYLGWIAGNPITPHYRPLEATNFAFMKDWGMKVNLEDVRVVIRQAHRGGRTVILGGHSLGASMAAAYAAWDFDGHAGYRDIAGIVAIDGGLLGSFGSAGTAAQARERLAALAPGRDGPWLNLLGIPGFAWATGAFAEVGALAALKAPAAPSILAGFPLLPAYLKAPVATTNEAALGYAFDSTTSPPVLSLIQVRAGQLAAAGDPRGWQDGEVTPIQNVARTFAQGRVNAVDWYYPTRLSIDVGAAGPMNDNPAARVLGLRLRHLRQARIPYYAFQTSLTAARNGVIDGARSFAGKAGLRKGQLVTVDAGATTSHLDPLLAAPKASEFLKTVVPFLKRIR